MADQDSDSPGDSPGDSINEARITELETRIAFQEDLLNTLNDVIANQDQRLSALIRKLDRLEEQQRENGFGGGGDGLADEPPPHY